MFDKFGHRFRERTPVARGSLNTGSRNFPSVMYLVSVNDYLLHLPISRRLKDSLLRSTLLFLLLLLLLPLLLLLLFTVTISLGDDSIETFQLEFWLEHWLEIPYTKKIFKNWSF